MTYIGSPSELLPCSSQFFPAGDGYLPFSNNNSTTSSPLHTQQLQQAAGTELVVETLITQLKQLPHALEANASTIALPGSSEAAFNAAHDLACDLQLGLQLPSHSQQQQQQQHMQGSTDLQSLQQQRSSSFSPYHSVAADIQAASCPPKVPAALLAPSLSGRFLHPAFSAEYQQLQLSTSAQVQGTAAGAAPVLTQHASTNHGGIQHRLGNAAGGSSTAASQSRLVMRSSLSGLPELSQEASSAQLDIVALQHMLPRTSSPGKPPNAAAAQQAALLAELQANVMQLGEANADLQGQLAATQAQFMDVQQQLTDSKGQLAAAEQGKAVVQEQLEHMGIKARSQESQLEFAHQQLDARQQELRGQATALETAQRNAQQLQEEVAALTEELTRTRRDADAVNKQVMMEASDAKQRLTDESSSLKSELSLLSNELNRARQDLSDTREQLRQLQADSSRRITQLEGQAADLSQQLMVARERASALESQSSRMNQQLSAAESENAALRSELSMQQAARQQLEGSYEQLRQLQQEGLRQAAQFQHEAADASQQLMGLRTQNEMLSQRLAAADSSKASLQAELGNSWQAARTASRAAEEAKTQLLQSQHQINQLRQQLQQLQQQQQWAATSSAVVPEVSGFGISRLPDDHRLLGSSLAVQASWADRHDPRSQAAASSQAGEPSALAVYASHDWSGQPGSDNGRGGPLAASKDFAPWAHQQQQQQMAAWDIPELTREASRAGAGQQQQASGVQPVAQAAPWFAGGSSSLRSLPQTTVSKSHSSWQQAASPASPRTMGANTATRAQQQQQPPQQQQLPAQRSAVTLPAEQSGLLMAERSEQWRQRPAGSNAMHTPTPSSLQVQSSAAELGYGGSTLPLSREMMSVVELMAATKQLEDQLLALGQERDEVNRELAKMPLGAGRTINERQRKVALETRLDELNMEISRLRTQVKRLNGDIKK